MIPTDMLNKVHCMDALELMARLPDESVNCIVTRLLYPPYSGIINIYTNTVGNMRDKKGKFIKGQRSSPKTEFKKGEHWREEKLFWNRDWLFAEYVDKQRSAADIAAQFNVTETAILFWLKKLDIPRRSMREIRAKKHWGLTGESNGMFGKTGAKNPRWRGGISPERQSLYSSQEWADAVRIVWPRDNRTCQRCGYVFTWNGERKMHIHHIVSFAVIDLRTNPDNLILLCEKCHKWVHSKKNVNGDFIKDE